MCGCASAVYYGTVPISLFVVTCPYDVTSLLRRTTPDITGLAHETVEGPSTGREDIDESLGDR